MTQTEWIAHFVLAAAYELLPQADQQEIQREMLLDLKRRWVPQQLSNADSNSDGQLSYDEFQSLAGDAYEVRMVDSDADNFISMDELLEYFDEPQKFQKPQEFPTVTREWAERQIAKYDRNRDGELDETEWEVMLIKPLGADENGDGKITVEEFARFRRK